MKRIPEIMLIFLFFSLCFILIFFMIEFIKKKYKRKWENALKDELVYAKAVLEYQKTSF